MKSYVGKKFMWTQACSGEIVEAFGVEANSMLVRETLVLDKTQGALEHLVEFKIPSIEFLRRLDELKQQHKADEEESDGLCNIMQMPRGKFPIRYLGVPLITSRLSYKDCQPILDKMQAKIKSWAVKTLSYGGRLQLVNCVLNSIHMHWSSLFILPRKLIKKIDGLMAAFLWSGEAKNKYNTKVSWTDVCSELKEGGLGILGVEVRNKVLIMKHIWNICVNKDSLWIKWVHSILLKGKNFWSVKIPADTSWSWRKLLQLRNEIRPYIKVQIGNGENTSLWHDNCHPRGPLIETFSSNMVKSFGSYHQACVADIIDQGQWKWPTGRRCNAEVKQMINELNFKPSVREKDIVYWKESGCGAFTTSSATKIFRKHVKEVHWHQLIWFNSSVPQISFVTWLVCRKRLLTKDRLRKWGIEVRDIKCELCGSAEESHNHLFFECEVTNAVWRKTMELCLVYRIPLTWEEEIQWLSKHYNKKTFAGRIRKLAFTTCVYQIWKARNSAVHKGYRSSAVMIVCKIADEMRLTVASWKAKKRSKENVEIAIEWGMNLNCFE